jgi:hypothetical protein
MSSSPLLDWVELVNGCPHAGTANKPTVTVVSRLACLLMGDAVGDPALR